MDVPYAEELREVRQRARESLTAVEHLRKLQFDLYSVDILDRQVSQNPDLDFELPGDGTVEMLAESWPELADLAAAGPRPGQDGAARLAMRRAQFQLAKQVLHPRSLEAEAHTRKLDTLHHTQHEALQKQGLEEVNKQVLKLRTHHSESHQALLPLVQKLEALQPTLRVLEEHMERLGNEIALSERDPKPLYAWRAAFIAAQHIESVQTIVTAIDLEIAVPTPEDVDADVDDARVPHYREQAQRMAGVLRELAEVLRAELTAVTEAEREARGAYEAATARLLDVTG